MLISVVEGLKMIFIDYLLDISFHLDISLSSMFVLIRPKDISPLILNFNALMFPPYSQWS